MRFIEYILAAVLGSAGVATAGTPGEPSTRTLTADAITRPSGGAKGLFGRNPGGDPDRPDKVVGTGRKGRLHARRGRRTTRKTGNTAATTNGKKAGPLPVPPKTEKEH
jgi:hypothetical protein